MNCLKHIIALLCTITLWGCQHGIDPDELDLPPEPRIRGYEVSGIKPEEAEKELKEIAATPYPPYTIQGGDSFRIRVYNEEELNSAASTSTVVTPDGYLIMGLIDPVNVKDLTIIEATNKLRKELSKFVKNPAVSLLPERIQGKSATLYGAVRDPGNYPVNDNTLLSDFIAAGKGYAVGVLDDNTADYADMSKSYIIRDGKILPVNFIEALERGNQLHNIKIFPQDIVYIAKKEDSRVMIMGEVNKPRSMNWNSNMTVLDTITQAGGLKEDYWGTALILRKPREAANGALDVYKVSIDDLLAGRARNFYVEAGDIVYIPKDSLGEYNVFIRKLMPTAQLINLLMSPPAYWFSPRR